MNSYCESYLLEYNKIDEIELCVLIFYIIELHAHQPAQMTRKDYQVQHGVCIFFKKNHFVV
jgi:hypothetical protein